MQDKKVLDVVTLLDSGEVKYKTGEAKDILETTQQAEPNFTMSQAFFRLAGTSNGYLSFVVNS